MDPKSGLRMSRTSGSHRLREAKLRNMLTGLTIAIPVLSDVDSAIRKVRAVRGAGFGGRIIVSINSWGVEKDSKDIQLQFKLLDCEIHLHKNNKGLYGNFKFLLDQVETSHFMWTALDDVPPAKILESSWRVGLAADLVIGDLNLMEFNSGEFGPTVESINASSFFLCDELQIHPGFVFGVWRTEFVREVWPKSPMDWLDTYILLCARTNGTVKVAEVKDPWTIGQSQKAPHKVNGRFHNPIRWGWKVLCLYGFRKSPKKYLSLMRAFAGKVHFGINELSESLGK